MWQPMLRLRANGFMTLPKVCKVNYTSLFYINTEMVASIAVKESNTRFAAQQYKEFVYMYAGATSGIGSGTLEE
jgi:hypothetical protein